MGLPLLEGVPTSGLWCKYLSAIVEILESHLWNRHHIDSRSNSNRTELGRFGVRIVSVQWCDQLTNWVLKNQLSHVAGESKRIRRQIEPKNINWNFSIDNVIIANIWFLDLLYTSAMTEPPELNIGQWGRIVIHSDYLEWSSGSFFQSAVEYQNRGNGWPSHLPAGPWDLYFNKNWSMVTRVRALSWTSQAMMMIIMIITRV